MSEKRTVGDVYNILDTHSVAEMVAQMWGQADMNRQEWKQQKLEVRNYLFATDTTTTSNGSLPWKNSTTLPKLTQIRDNLHANYMSALFPSEDWMKWEGGDQASATAAKARSIQQYLMNKTKQSGFEETISRLLLDYIDYGDVNADVIFVRESHHNDETGEEIPGYIGPKLVRHSYRDIVYDPLAATFDSSWKITRSLKSMGEVMAEVENEPENAFKREVVEKAAKLRNGSYGLNTEDFDLITAYAMDGFGTFQQYVNSGYCEFLEFEGSLYDAKTGQLHKNQIITVIDRCWVIRQESMPSWLGKSTKLHAAWRERPDNIYGMGPLDNLVGMQYRVDHLENAKADAHDLAIHPPLVIYGNVEDFEYGPGAEIYLGEGGKVDELGKSLQGVMAASNEIEQLLQRMEMFAGAPREAMGIRTPGEKTMFEVQTLDQAASRIFQHRLRHFEKHILEPALMLYLEIGRRNMEGADLIRVMDDDLGAATFLSITKDDITASGKITVTGSRHFAEQATMVQNLMALSNSTFAQDPGIRVHWSGKAIAKLLEELLGLEKFRIFQENVQVMETTQTTQFQQQGQEEVAATNMTPPDAPLITAPPTEEQA